MPRLPATRGPASARAPYPTREVRAVLPTLPDQVLPLSTPLGVLELDVRARVERARQLDAAGDRGASAIEWVMISAILVVIAVGLGTYIIQQVRDKEADINLDTPAY